MKNHTHNIMQLIFIFIHYAFGIMRVAAGERAVCEISQLKYYYRQRRGGKITPLFPIHSPTRLVITVPFQLYA